MSRGGSVPSAHLLPEKTCPVCIPPLIRKSPLAVIEDAQIAKKLQKFIMAKKISRVSRVTENPLVDQVGFEDDIASKFEGFFHFRDQGSLEIIEIQDKIVCGLG